MHSKLLIPNEDHQGPEGILFVKVHQQYSCYAAHALAVTKTLEKETE